MEVSDANHPPKQGLKDRPSDLKPNTLFTTPQLPGLFKGELSSRKARTKTRASVITKKYRLLPVQGYSYARKKDIIIPDSFPFCQST